MTILAIILALAVTFVTAELMFWAHICRKTAKKAIKIQNWLL